MTIEQKALELDLIARVIGAYHTTRLSGADVNAHILGKPHVREAFERLAEADKARHAAELREQAERFSEAAERLLSHWAKGAATRAAIEYHLSPFILAPVDPLVEVVGDVFDCNTAHTAKNLVADLRAALDARGLAIVKKEAV